MSEAAKTKKKGKLKWLILVIVVIAAAAAVFFIKRPVPGNFAASSGEAEVTRMTIEKTLESDGEVESALEEDILPHTSYYLGKINVEEGEAVKEGDTILTYTNGNVLKAPYNCVVMSWDLPEKGEQITSDHYVKIAGTDVMQMELSLSDSEVLKLSVGDAAKVTIDAVDSTYDAEVSYISEIGEYSSGSSTFAARVTFDNDGSLKIGMSGSAVISLEKAEDVLAVPVNAISTKGGKSFVTVKSGEEESLVEVETGITNGTFTEIKSGLSEGDKVTVRSDSSSDSRSDMPGGFGGFPEGGPEGIPDGAPGDFGGGGFPGGGSGGPGGSGREQGKQ